MLDRGTCVRIVRGGESWIGVTMQYYKPLGYKLYLVSVAGKSAINPGSAIIDITWWRPKSKPKAINKNRIKDLNLRNAVESAVKLVNSIESQYIEY